VIWLITILRGGLGRGFGALGQHPVALRTLVAGAFLGPAIGVWLSLAAVQRAPVGVASTLMALPPIILLPVDRVLFKVPIGRSAIAGTLIAILGTALLFR